MAHQYLRSAWLKLHLYLGLSIGALFVLMGVTGSLLVFYTHLDRSLNPNIQVISTGSTPSAQAILDQLRHHYPQRTAGWRIEMPMHADTPVTARYLKPEESHGRSFSPLVVTLDPATLTITSSRLWGDTIMTWLYDLHYTLLLDTNGKTIIAITGFFILLSLISGIYLWWPRQGHWRSALTYRHRAHFYRKIYDWHTLSGVYGLILLAMLTITGIMLEKPDWFESWLGAAPGMLHMGSTVLPEASSGNHAAEQTNLDTMAKTALQQFPGSRLRWIYTPDTATGHYQFRLYQPGEPGQRFPKTIVTMDHTGQVIDKQDYFKANSGNKIMYWLHPLHNGEAFGLTGRWLVLIAGLLPLMLFMTGWLRWRQKQRVANLQHTKKRQSI